MNRIIYVRPLAGVEPEKAEVLFEGKSHILVRLGLGMETVFVKNATLYADTEAEYWEKMARGEQNRIDAIQKDLAHHEQLRLAFLEMSKRAEARDNILEFFRKTKGQEAFTLSPVFEEARKLFTRDEVQAMFDQVQGEA